jgi:glycosyltransferase involved in cell wall biosynthesis
LTFAAQYRGAPDANVQSAPRVRAAPLPDRAPPRRILHVFSTFAVGGPQRRFAAIANHFGDSFHHIVRAMDGRTDARYLVAPSAACTFVEERFPRAGLVATRRLARRLLRDAHPDVLVTYNWGAVEWALANWPPLVRHIHIEDGFGPEEAHRQLRRRVWFRRAVLRDATVILPSQTLVRIATDIWKLDPQRLIYVPNGIPCQRFGVAPDPVLTGRFRGQGPVIGTVATLRREKALDRLIGAFADVVARRPAHLVIAGEGPERAALEALAGARGLARHVTFTGQVERPERLFGAFDIFAVSSETEQMPLSVLEAMAAALPIAATDAGDILDMVAAENRPFVVAKAAAPLAGALHRLLDDAGLRARLGAANRARALAHFDEPRMFEAYGRLFSGADPKG